MLQDWSPCRCLLCYSDSLTPHYPLLRDLCYTKYTGIRTWGFINVHCDSFWQKSVCMWTCIFWVLFYTYSNCHVLLTKKHLCISWVLMTLSQVWTESFVNKDSNDSLRQQGWELTWNWAVWNWESRLGRFGLMEMLFMGLNLSPMPRTSADILCSYLALALWKPL